METKIYQINEQLIRLDKFLARELPSLSRSYIQQLIINDNVRVNGLNTKASHKISSGDTVSITLPQQQDTAILPEPIPLRILYEDNDVIVINKPAGMTVYPAAGHRSNTLLNALIAYYPSLAAAGDPKRPGIVHRLDKDTSGLLVIAKNTAARDNLAGQFKLRTISKIYLALVKGRIQSPRGIIEAQIGRDPYNRKKMAVVEKGKDARTEYRLKEYAGNYSLLEVLLKTGRTHQIRVHFSAIGYPVAGDPIYGGKVPFLKRQFLNAHKLCFILQSTGIFREFK
jgi:23S rRNA pseudouridine1911/1915/1917 synthase